MLFLFTYEIVKRKIKIDNNTLKTINYLRLGHNYSIFITNKASLLVYDVLVKQYTSQQTSTKEINIYSN